MVASMRTPRRNRPVSTRAHQARVALGGILQHARPARRAVHRRYQARGQRRAREAHRLHIPIVGLIDTNADPDDIDYGIPRKRRCDPFGQPPVPARADALVAGSGTVVTELEMTADADKEVPAIPEAGSPKVGVSRSTVKGIEEEDRGRLPR